VSILRAPLCPVTRVVLQPGIRMRIGVKSCEIWAAIVLHGSHAPKHRQAGPRTRAVGLEIDRVETGRPSPPHDLPWQWFDALLGRKEDADIFSRQHVLIEDEAAAGDLQWAVDPRQRVKSD
jgi:hypothetical protein